MSWTVAACARITGHVYRIDFRHYRFVCVNCRHRLT